MGGDVRVLIKGAGDLATGVAVRLWRAGFRVAMTELEQPLAIRRSVAFSEAVYDGKATVEEVTARRVEQAAEAEAAWNAGEIPILVDAEARSRLVLKPEVLVDAVLAKRNTGTRLSDAPLVVGLGPGFTAGQEVHAVVETNRGHYLGRVLWSGTAQADTGTPGVVNGVGRERVIYAPAAGTFKPRIAIGTVVDPGDLIGWMDETPVKAPIAGVLRGLMRGGVRLAAGVKMADVDPRGVVDHCWTISDKALAIGGGVLEAILVYLRGKGRTGAEGGG
jgi:xanthine dehydrogenase accessory factor